MDFGSLFIWFVSQLVMAGAVYGGIRADIKNMHFLLTTEREDRIREDERLRQSLRHAHERINTVSDRRHHQEGSA